jgi:hypothetical protein
MKKFRFIVIGFLVFILSSALYATTSYDDAQWSVYDNSPTGASVSNDNGTVTFDGNGISNGYKFTIDNNVNEFNFSWNMNFSTSYIVYILVYTDQGYRFLYYTNASEDRGIHPSYTSYIHHGLGDETSITRNLQADLQEFESANNIKSVKGFYIRGNGQMSNIRSFDDSEDTTDPEGPTDPEDPDENYNVVVYEDAEDGNTDGWSIYSTNKNGTVSNVIDEDNPDNRVIQFEGEDRKTGFRLGNNHGRVGAWESPHTKIRWRMKYSEPYAIFVRVLTKNETENERKYKFRYMYYTALNRNVGVVGKYKNYIHHGLGVDTRKDGKWHTIERDLEADLKEFEPNNSIVSVNAFLIRGSGQIDDITLYSTNEEEDEFPTLLADYRFDDCLWNMPNTVINSSGDGLKGTAFDDASLTADGLINNGGHFNGNGYISMGNVLNPGAIDKTSISVWFKWDGSDNSNVIFSKENVYMAEVRDGYFRYAINPKWSFNDDQSFSVEANVWTHAVITYDGERQKLYKNGELVHSRTVTGDIGSNSHPFTVGAFKRLSGNPTYFFHGDIDELKVFGGALSSSQVQEIYKNESEKRKYDDYNTPREEIVCSSSIEVSIADTTCIEGEDCIFDVNLSENATSHITIEYVTSNSDTTDDDYTPTSGTLTIAQNSSSGTITVPTTDDSDIESNETFTITISNAKLDDRIDLTINDNQANGLIINDDKEIIDPPVDPTEQSKPWLDYEVYTLYEDGEDASNWSTYSGSGEITQVVDGNRSAIKLSGSGRSTGYKLNSDNWNNTSEFNLYWSMKYSENYTMYVGVQTTRGFKYIQYTPVSVSPSSTDRVIRIGLGVDTKDGTWRSFSRNLQDDLHTAEPDNNIIAVKSFLIRGSGMIDDVFLFSEDTTEPESENSAPIAYEQNVTVDENSNVDIVLTATDVDQEDGTLSFEVSTPSHGELTGEAPNLTYTPNADYDGSDSFTYTVTDEQNATATATINITINNTTAETDLPSPKAHFDYKDLGANGLDFTKNSIGEDGDDFVSLDYSTINGLEDFTISTWIKSGDLNGRSIISGVNDSTNNNQVNNELHLIINYDNYIYMVIKDRESPVRLPYRLNDNQWHMITWTREGDTSCIFIDGENKAGCVSGYQTGGLVIAEGGFILGQEQDSVGGGFDIKQNFLGYQDEIRIYDQVLTAKQIKAIYEIDKAR